MSLRQPLIDLQQICHQQRMPSSSMSQGPCIRLQFGAIVILPSRSCGIPLGKDGELVKMAGFEPVMYCKEAAPLEVRDIMHLYCKDDLCKESRKCQCLSVGLQCTEFCACGFLDCTNVTHPMNDENTEDI